MKKEKIYRFGDCVPESYKLYSRLKKRGESPVICEGYVVTNRKIIDKNNECVDIIVAGKQRKVLPHTWVRNGNKIIDITKNQFNKYEGINWYIQSSEYQLNKKNRFDPGTEIIREQWRTCKN